MYLPTYVECSCLRERWLPHQGGPHLPHSVRHTLICVWRHRRAWGEAPVHAHTYVRTYVLTYSVCCTPELCRRGAVQWAVLTTVPVVNAVLSCCLGQSLGGVHTLI